jgi:hypothetical protein
VAGLYNTVTHLVNRSGIDALRYVLTFASGIAATYASARLSANIQRRRERQRELDRLGFDIYMDLMTLSSSYYWVSVKELHNEPLDVELQRRLRDQSWRLLDKLRADDLPETPEIARLLIDAGAFSTARERDYAIRDLCGRLGQRVNPRYASAVRAATPNNLQATGFDWRARAITPGLMDAMRDESIGLRPPPPSS